MRGKEKRVKKKKRSDEDRKKENKVEQNWNKIYI